VDAFQIGPFTIKLSWLFISSSLFFTYLVLDSLLNKYPKEKVSIFYNIVLNSLFIVFLSYKFAYILFRPSIVWENPIGMIYFTGGIRELILGLVLSSLYVISKFINHKMNQWLYWKLIVYGFVTFSAAYCIVQTVFSLLI
jgi:prolipoprotein diacylglyceryltransferase